MLEFTIRNFNDNDWITAVMLLIISMLIFAKMQHQDKFNKTLQLFYNNRYFLNYSKESNRTFNSFNITFQIIQLLSFSLLGFVLLEKWSVFKNQEFSISFWNFFFFIAIFFIGKLILIKVIGAIFRFQKLQNDLIFFKISYLNLIAICLLPLTAFLVYGKFINNYIVNISLVYTLFLFFYTYGLILVNNKKIIYNNIFYFILYICTLEIAPFLIILKLVF